MSLQNLSAIDTDMQQPVSRLLADAFAGAGNDGNSLIYVSPDGDDTDGDGSLLTPYLTLAVALAACTTTRKNIIVLPGEYEELVTLVWPNITGISIVGIGDVTITVPATETDEVIKIDPTFSASTFTASLENVTISAPDGVDGIRFNNTNTTGRKFNLTLKNVSIENETATDKSLYVVHTTTTQAMRVYADGLRNIWEGLLFITPENVDDRFFFTNIQCDGGMQFGTATIASSTMFKNCIVKDGGGSGGQDTQILTALNCHSLTAETTYAIAALADFASNAKEVILPAA